MKMAKGQVRDDQETIRVRMTLKSRSADCGVSSLLSSLAMISQEIAGRARTTV